MLKRILLVSMVVLWTLSAQADQLKTLKVNRAYGSLYSIAVPQEFQIIYNPNHTKLVYPALLDEKDVFFKLQFIEPNQQLSENLILKYFKVPLYTESKRVSYIKQKMVDVINTYAHASVIGFVETKIKKYTVVMGHAVNQGYYLTLYTIINPQSHHSVMGLINIDPRLSEVKTYENLSQNELGRAKKVLLSFEYGKELM